MTDYAVSTNLISWVPAMHDVFGWPSDLQEAELVRAMRPGDVIVPKFAQNPTWGDQEEYQREICGAFGAVFDDQHAAYMQTVAAGAGAVPFLLRVVGPHTLGGESPLNWTCVSVKREPLPYPISTSEFLRLRKVPIELAGQFKAMAAPGRRIQVLPDGTAEFVRRAGSTRRRGSAELRTETLVHAKRLAEATQLLAEAGFHPHPGDRTFLFGEEGIAGLHAFEEEPAAGMQRFSQGQPIAIPPRQLRGLLEAAAAKALPSDYFTPARAFRAADDMVAMLDSGDRVRHVPEFAQFHDRFVILDSKVTKALEISQRQGEPVPDGGVAAAAGAADDDGDEDPELVDLDKLNGLTIEAVHDQLGPFVIPRAVLAEAVTALRSGKHLLLSGPPGTGKSTIATALARAVVESRYRVVTATADWTSFDTIGGYMPQPGGELAFEPGTVLRCLDAGLWLVIDELNRADIDKAFGPLFTLLASNDAQAQAHVTLPYRQGGKDVEIGWARTLSKATTRYAVTPAWRIIGTMNAADKASLFQLSFAFLRRFAVVDVPLPDSTAYAQLLSGWFDQLRPGMRDQLVSAGLEVAHGPVPLGPAILRDIAAFTTRGVIATTTGSAPYENPVEAFLAAVRLYAAPQYERATQTDAATLTDRLRARLAASTDDAAWVALERALHGAVLTAG